MGLSGVKKKQVISSDPQNLAWKNDTSSFGYKMLQKMGWHEGKGLGLNEDGDTQHIKIKLKENNYGLGADIRTVDNWLGNTSAFSRLLESLNSSTCASDAESDAKSKPDSKSKKKSKKKSNSDNKTDKKTDKNSDKKKKSKKEKSGMKIEENVVMQGRLYHRSKFVKNKKIAFTDPEALKGILGV